MTRTIEEIICNSIRYFESYYYILPMRPLNAPLSTDSLIASLYGDIGRARKKLELTKQNPELEAEIGQ